MSKEARTFNELKKEKSFEELNRFAKEVTELYAKSDYVYSQKNVANDNRLSVKGLRNLMDYAIVTNLVSLEIAKMVLRKSVKCQQTKAEDAGGNSHSHHIKLMEKRNNFIAGSYTKTQIRNIATSIAEDFSKPISYFSRKYEIESDAITKMLLERAIVESIISDEIMEKIFERSLKGKKDQKIELYFDSLRQKRKSS